LILNEKRPTVVFRFQKKNERLARKKPVNRPIWKEWKEVFWDVRFFELAEN
jgi:hypothetical protein